MAFLELPDKLEDDYRAPLEAWQQQPGPATAGALLRAVEPEIRRGISAHVGRGNPLLHSRARRLVLESLPRYNARQSRLGTYIVNQLQGLKRINRQQTQILRLPERVSLDAQFLERAEADLTEQLGRPPALSELADFSGLSARRIQHVRQFQAPVSEGYLDYRSQQQEGGGMLPAVAQAGGRDPVQLVYPDLEPINQKILEWSLGLYGQPQLANREIARRLRLTPGAISQRKARIQQLLDEAQNYLPG